MISIDDSMDQMIILEALQLYKMIFNFEPLRCLLPKDGTITDTNNFLDHLIDLFTEKGNKNGNPTQTQTTKKS